MDATPQPASAARLWTIGHSTRTWDVFADMLAEAEIGVVADVRRHPGSRRHPQFSAESMATALPRAGIVYLPVPALGGRRPASADSRNTAWRNASFRGYADYMQSEPYHAASNALAAQARLARTALLCAEAVWWQCHRGLIADQFKSDGWEVVHLVAPGRQQVHPYTAAARLVDGRLDYSAAPEAQRTLFD